MAMIKCPGCGAEISDKAGKCVKCNYILDVTTKKEDRSLRKRILLVGIVALIVILMIIFVFLRGIFFKVNINRDSLEAGETISVSNIIEPKYSFVSLTNSDSVVNTQMIGKVSIPYTLHWFIFSTNRIFETEVIDTKSPIISGSDSLTITNVADVNWGELYEVNDFTPNLEEKIMIEGDIPTSEGIYDLVLTVKDESGNVGEKQIKVEIVKPTKDEEVIMQFINVLIDKKNYNKEDIVKLRMYASNDKAYFFEINGKDIYYYGVESSDLYTFDEAALIAGYYKQKSSYELMLGILLQDVDMTRIQKLMQ